MAFTMGILAVVGGGLGIAEVMSSKPKGSDSSGMPALPSPPDPNAAANNAQAAQTKQRQILLASGGQTDFTGGTGALLGSDTGKATLLGG